MKQLIAEISQAALNIVFPIYCQSCGVKLAYDNKIYLCQNCLDDIRLNRPPFCIRCGRALTADRDAKTVCPDCLKRRYYFDAAWQCCEYDGPMKELIHKFKYCRKLFLKNLFVDIMHRFVKDHIDYKGIDAITAVPMHHANLNKRGFNQAALLSKGLSRMLGIINLEGCIFKTKNTKQQVNLDRKERFHNIKDAFSAKKDADIKGKRLLLIDDVFTTGATADECAKALADAGAKSVWALALARGA